VVCLGLLSLHSFTRTLRVDVPWPGPVRSFFTAAAPFHFTNSYGLFAVMTKDRPEITVEGSQDGREWKAYAFRYKPGDPAVPPSFVQPHQPRLDWQMWFAALGGYQNNPWFLNFCARLVQGSPAVLKLLKTDPFAGVPPRYVRATVADYRFTSSRERAETGAYWTQGSSRIYLPPISLRQESN
jgi:lipase maturation factor 1